MSLGGLYCPGEEGGWQKFPSLELNQKLAIESLYFNSPGLVGYRNNQKVLGPTDFYIHMQRYIRSGKKDLDALNQAVYEVWANSNKDKHKGVQNRRNREAMMLCNIKPSEIENFNKFNCLMKNQLDELYAKLIKKSQAK